MNHHLAPGESPGDGTSNISAHEHPPTSATSVASRRVIILGASNVTMSFPLIVRAIQSSLPRPVDIFAAHGHGRSFCAWSYVLHRGLPSIMDCGIWRGL